MRTLLCVLLFPFYVFSQENGPAFNLRIAPLALLNPVQQSVAFQADFPVAKRWAIDMGLGMVFNSEGQSNEKGEQYMGIKLKPAIKYFFPRTTRRGGRHTLSLAFKYNHIINDRYVILSRQGRQYVEESLERRDVVSGGFVFQYALIKFFGKSDRWFIEPFFGLGARWVKNTQRPLPPDAFIIREDFFAWEDDDTYDMPDVMMGFNIGYAW